MQTGAASGRQAPRRTYAATTYAQRYGERHGPLSAAYAEPDNLRTLTAVIDTSAQRTESAGAVWDRM